MSNPAPAPKDPHQLALEEVLRLRAQAELDPVLAPWSGPYGGVPPWDQLKLERVPAGFATGIATLSAPGAELELGLNVPLPCASHDLA